MADDEVKLIGMWASPFACRVEIALKLKAIEYEYVEEDLLNKSPLLLKNNPVHKKVPVLVHNGKPIAESLAILEYIDETWKKNTLLPQDAHGRALARFWAKCVDEKLLLSAWNATFGSESQREKDEALAEFHEVMSVLEKELEGKEYFGGEKLGFLDLVVMLIPFWFGRSQEIARVELLTKEKFPLIFEWAQKLPGIDAVKHCLPPKEKHLAYMIGRLEASKASKTTSN